MSCHVCYSFYCIGLSKIQSVLYSEISQSLLSASAYRPVPTGFRFVYPVFRQILFLPVPFVIA